MTVRKETCAYRFDERTGGFIEWRLSAIYGIFYYGSLGIPTETTFSEQFPIKKDSYVTSYPAFVSGLGSPAVYLNMLPLILVSSIVRKTPRILTSLMVRLT